MSRCIKKRQLGHRADNGQSGTLFYIDGIGIWRQISVTSHLGDKPSGRQTSGQHILVNWATEVETTGLQLWKCERLTIAVQEQLCAVLGQRPFNITHQTNLPHSSLECYEVAGLIDASQCSVNQTAQLVSLFQCCRPVDQNVSPSWLLPR